MYKKRDSVGYEMTEICHSSNVWWIIEKSIYDDMYRYMDAGATNGFELNVCMYCTCIYIVRLQHNSSFPQLPVSLYITQRVINISHSIWYS